jgi:DNA-directed RNA polymerase specialized sigma24 family protein
MLGISEGTSKWHLSDGKKKLREMIKLSEHEGA